MPEKSGGQTVLPLTGTTVLVTRPRAQARRLCDLIRQQGGEPVEFPTIDIRPVLPDAQTRLVLADPERIDIVIFISANAVQHAFDRLPIQGWLNRVTVAAIGRATKRALLDHRINVGIAPDNGNDSEALLATVPLKNVDGKHILIFKGVGGRDLLQKTLTERGAQVTAIDVYERSRPDTDSKALVRQWQQSSIDLVTLTSQETLYNLYHMLDSEGQALLKETPLVVISQRVADAARELGLQAAIRVASEASDQALVEAVVQLWQQERQHD